MENHLPALTTGLPNTVAKPQAKHRKHTPLYEEQLEQGYLCRLRSPTGWHREPTLRASTQQTAHLTESLKREPR